MSEISFDNFLKSAADVAATGSGVQAASAASQGGDDSFAGVFSALVNSQSATQMTSPSGSSGSSAGYLSSLGSINGDSGALSALLASGTSGEDMDSDLGMLLLYMLMNMESGSGSDSSMMMLSSLLSAASGERSYAAAAQQAGGTGSLFDTLVSDAAASKAASGTISSPGVGGDLAPLNCWVPTNPSIRGDTSFRSAEMLNQIIGQFDVESTARYTPHKYGSDTYCNIFVWDVTSALGCEIPHWVDGETGAPRQFPDIKGAVELGANATYGWLGNHGEEYGWHEVSAEEAQMYANKGFPAVTTWKNPGGGAGHVQIVRPSEDGAYDASRGVAVAQAGGHNYEYTYTGSIYSSNSLPQVRYYVHA